MARTKNTIPSKAQMLKLPEPIHDRLVLHLWSEVEGRVPQGAYQQFFITLLNQFFNNRTLDLFLWAQSLPGEFLVSGSPASIEALKRIISSKE